MLLEFVCESHKRKVSPTVSEKFDDFATFLINDNKLKDDKCPKSYIKVA